MSFPILLYLNLLQTSGAVITASSTDSGFDVADVADYRPWSVWKSGTVVTGITIDIDLGSSPGNADTVGLVNHNITSEGGTVQVKADTVTPPAVVVQAAYTPAYGDVDLQQFTAPGAKRYWRVTLSKGGNFTNKPYIGELFLGMRTTLTEYMDPGFDPFFKQVETSSVRSEAGHYLGAILRGQRHQADLAHGPAGANRSFFTSDLNAFLDNHAYKRRPFFFQVDADDSDFKKPYYIRLGDAASIERKAVGGVWSRLGLKMGVEEAWSETP